MTITTIFAKANDATVSSRATNAQGYAAAREGTGLDRLVSNPASALFEGLGQRHQASGSPNFGCSENFLAFATGVIPDADTITSVTFSMHTFSLGVNGPDFDLELRQDIWQPAVDSGDYVPGSQLGSRTLYATLNTSGLTDENRFDWSENGSNLRDAINKTGDTEFLICSSRTRLDLPPPNDTINEVIFYTADQAGTTKDPRLILVHSSPPGPPSGPFPVVQGFATSSDLDFTGPPFSYTVALPAGIVAGELLLAIFGLSDNFAITWPAGWTEFFELQNVGNVTLSLAYRVADGTEGASIEVQAANVGRSAHVAYRISGAEDPLTQAPEISAGASAFNQNPNPDNLIPAGGAKNYLFLVPMNSRQVGLTSFPTNYSSGHFISNTSLTVAAAERQLNATSEDPGTYSVPNTAQWLAATVAIHPAPGAAVALSGTITDDNELDIRNGGSTIVLTLTNDTWVAAGATFDGQRQNIIDGLVSAQSEANGWNAVARPAIPVAGVVRTSDTVVAITMPAVPDYSITATETITATVPASALVTATDPLVADPPFAISFLNESAVVTGTITLGVEEGDIRTGGLTLVISLINATWEANVGADNAQTQDLIDGLVSSQGEPAGWNAVVQAGLTFNHVVRNGDTVVTIIMPAFPGYSISQDETITVTVPASALNFPVPLVASPSFVITNVPGTIETGGVVAAQQRLLLL